MIRNKKEKIFYSFVGLLLYIIFMYGVYQYNENNKILFEYIVFSFLFILFIFSFMQAIKKEIKAEHLEKLEKEKVLAHQHKLAQMGELLNNIAHQWRQPLSSINSTVATIDNAFTKDKLDAKVLNDKITKIEDITEHMSNTISDFQNYFKPDKQKDKFYISETVKKAQNIISSSLIKNKIYLNIEIKNDKQLFIVQGEYIQVIISLLSNSIEQLVQNNISNPSLNIVIDNNLTICDNAGGIEEINLSKVFDLHFTTKEESNGTGIGLYMCKMIVENSIGGDISVENYQDGVKFIVEI